MIGFPDLVRQYGLPADPDQPSPRLRHPSRLSAAAGHVRGGARRRRRGRRLAFLDTTFPWRRSGFRYHEALALHALRPDTLFFSQWELRDAFPAPVHRLADFPAIAPAAGVTDAYAVFQVFLEGLVGLPTATGQPDAFAGPDLSAVLRNARIRLHGAILPGGGLVLTPEGIERTRTLAARLDTAFSYVPEVIAEVPGVTPVDQALTETSFYAPSDERWANVRPLRCLFAADRPPRKGVDVALRAFAGADPARFHLDVVGPHEDRRDALPADLATFHGWLSPEALRDLHRRAHVFVSPVSREPPGPLGSHEGVVDGFPTQAAADAMSSGCLLVSANPGADHRVLRPGEHYVECPAEPDALREALEAVAADVPRARRIAAAGSAQVRSRMDVRQGIAAKLRHLGLL
jgi:hypothetical protein